MKSSISFRCQLKKTALVFILSLYPVYCSEVVTKGHTFSVDFINQQNSKANIEIGLELQKKESCWNTPYVQELVALHCEKLTDEGRARLSMEVLNCYMKVRILPTTSLLFFFILTEWGETSAFVLSFFGIFHIYIHILLLSFSHP